MSAFMVFANHTISRFQANSFVVPGKNYRMVFCPA